MATEDLKKLVAREIAMGERISDVARHHGYTWKGMKALVQSREVQRLLAAERETLDELMVQQRAQLVVLGQQAIENIRSVVEDPVHPKCTDVSRWLLDKTAPHRTQVDASVHVEAAVPEAAQQEVRAALIKLSNEVGPILRASSEVDPDRHLLIGRDALPSAAKLPPGDLADERGVRRSSQAGEEHST